MNNKRLTINYHSNSKDNHIVLNITFLERETRQKAQIASISVLKSLLSSLKEEIHIALTLPMDFTWFHVTGTYIIQYYLTNKRLPSNELVNKLIYIEEIASKPETISNIVNINSLFLAIKKVNSPVKALEKLFILVDNLNEVDKSNIESYSTIWEYTQEKMLKDEVSLIHTDYEIHKQESHAISLSTKDVFDVVNTETSKIAQVHGKVYNQKSKSILLDHWLKMEGYSIYIQISNGNDKERQVFIKPLYKNISFKDLPRILNFFESYRANSEKKPWFINGSAVMTMATELNDEEIVNLIKDYTEPWVNQQKVKYVFPFHYDYRNFKKISKKMGEKLKLVDETEKHGKFEKNFLPLFNDYLFNNKELPNTQAHSKCFQITKPRFIQIQNNKMMIESKPSETDNRLYNRKVHAEIRLFKYGVGFLVLNSSFHQEEQVPLSYILEVDKIICDKVKEMVHTFLGEEKQFLFNSTRKGIVYEAIEIWNPSYHIDKRENIVLRTCSANKKTYISNSDELKQELNDKFLDRGDFVFYGFSRSCGVQYTVESPSFSRSGLEGLQKNFLEEKFYIFLFSIQQRDTVRQFSDKIVRSSLLSWKIGTSPLRKDFMEFVTQAKLSHISDNNVVTKFYNMWKNIFDSESIYEEVSNKLEAVDGFEQSKVSYHYNVLSFIVFPILIISSLFSMGMLQVRPAIPVGFNTVLIIMSAFVICVCLLFYKEKIKDVFLWILIKLKLKK